MPTRRAVRWILAVLLLATLPVPYYLGAFEIAPTLRLLFLATLVIGVAATEGVANNQALLTVFVGVLATLWTLLILGLAALMARVVAAITEGGARLVLLGALAAVLVVGSLFPIYTTPMSSHAPRSSILGLFD